MTLKNLLCVAVAAALMNSQALAQVTSQDVAGGPTISIDLLRNGSGNPIVNPGTGGLTYVVSVAPDSNQPVFGAGAGPNGTGASVAVELGFNVGGAGLASGALSTTLLPVGAADPVTVNLDNTPGVGTTASDPGNTAGGFVEFANPGNQIFGFEVPNVVTTDGTQIGGVQIDGNNVFAALGTTFFSSTTTGPYEILRIETGALNTTNAASLSPSLSLVANSIVAQSIDLSDATNPVSQAFSLPAVTDTDTIIGGDANLDGVVNFLDVSILSANVGGGGNWANANFNGDASVDFLDVSILSAGISAGPGTAPIVAASTAVPEPAGLALTILAGSFLAVRTRKR